MRRGIRALEQRKRSCSFSIGLLQRRLAETRSPEGASSSFTSAQRLLLQAKAGQLQDEAVQKLEALEASRLAKESQGLLERVASPASAAASVPSQVLSSATETLLRSRQKTQELQRRLRGSIAAYNDMVLCLKAKLSELGVPLDAVNAETLPERPLLLRPSISPQGPFQQTDDGSPSSRPPLQPPSASVCEASLPAANSGLSLSPSADAASSGGIRRNDRNGVVASSPLGAKGSARLQGQLVVKPLARGEPLLQIGGGVEMKLLSSPAK